MYKQKGIYSLHEENIPFKNIDYTTILYEISSIL